MSCQDAGRHFSSVVSNGIQQSCARNTQLSGDISMPEFATLCDVFLASCPISSSGSAMLHMAPFRGDAAVGFKRSASIFDSFPLTSEACVRLAQRLWRRRSHSRSEAWRPVYLSCPLDPLVHLRQEWFLVAASRRATCFPSSSVASSGSPVKMQRVLPALCRFSSVFQHRPHDVQIYEMASFALCIRHHNELRRNIRRRFPNGQRLTRQMYYPLVASVILASRRSASISQRLFCAFTKFICGLHAILCRRLDAPCRFFVIVSYGVSILLLAWFGITSAFRRQISLRTPTVC